MRELDALVQYRPKGSRSARRKPAREASWRREAGTSSTVAI